jgi:tetratricopeptide (TPR) repeat protein
MCNKLLCAVVAFALFGSWPQAQAGQQSESCDADAVFGTAKGLLAKKEYEQAAKALDALRGCPKLSSLQTFERGWLYGRARHFDASLREFGKVPPDVPDRLTHGYAIALSKFELSDFQGSANTLRAMRAAGVSDANSNNLLAVSYSRLGLYREAYDVLASEIQTTPNDLTTYLNLVTVCAEGGDLAKAAEVAEKAAQLFPNSAEVLIVRGAANSLLGRLESSYDDFAAAVRLAPERSDARFFLALAEYKNAKFADALAVLQSGIRAGLKDSDLHYLAAECLLKIDPGGTDAALEELNLAVRLNSGSVAARVLRGRLLLQAGQSKQAVADLELARKSSPDSRSAIYNLARAYRTVGRTKEAEVLFRQLRSETADTVGELSERRLSQAVTQRGDQPR